MLSQRVVLGIMSFLGTVVTFSMRACLSIAITEMVIPINNTASSYDSVICPAVSAPAESANITKTVSEQER